MSERTIVAYYDRKPPALVALLQTVQDILSAKLGSTFVPKCLDDIHATLLSIPPPNAGSISSLALSPLVHFLCTELRRSQLTLQIGGFNPDRNYDFTSRGQHLYQRTFSANRNQFIMIGWRDAVENVRLQGVYGLLDAKTVDRLVSRFDLHRPTTFGTTVWPDKMGEGYLNVLQVLLRNDPPGSGDYRVSDRLWLETRELREYSIRSAHEMELRRSGYGVRRGEIVNFAGRYLGVVRQDEGVADADVIMSRYSREHFGKVPYDAAGSFFDWRDELYRVNQAED
jgi:hypothetical protein